MLLRLGNHRREPTTDIRSVRYRQFATGSRESGATGHDLIGIASLKKGQHEQTIGRGRYCGCVHVCRKHRRPERIRTQLLNVRPCDGLPPVPDAATALSSFPRRRPKTRSGHVRSAIGRTAGENIAQEQSADASPERWLLDLYVKEAAQRLSDLDRCPGQRALRRMQDFLGLYGYDPQGDLREVADTLYDEVGVIAMALVSSKIKRLKDKL